MPVSIKEVAGEVEKESWNCDKVFALRAVPKQYRDPIAIGAGKGEVSVLEWARRGVAAAMAIARVLDNCLSDYNSISNQSKSRHLYCP
jgi:hypothetical protein